MIKSHRKTFMKISNDYIVHTSAGKLNRTLTRLIYKSIKFQSKLESKFFMKPDIVFLKCVWKNNMQAE